MQVNLMVLQSLLILSTHVFSQFNEVRPDVTFGDHNDRFDVSDLVSYQNKYFRTDGSIDYRRSQGFRKHPKFRSSNPKDKNVFFGSEKKRLKYIQKIKKKTEEQLNKLANMILLRMKSARRTGENDFAFHDDMESNGEGVNDFNENIEKFKRDLRKEVYEGKVEPSFDYRRVDTVPETFGYAFPIDMQIEGFLMPPENQ